MTEWAAVFPDRESAEVAADHISDGLVRKWPPTDPRIDLIRIMHRPFAEFGREWCTECSAWSAEKGGHVRKWPCKTFLALSDSAPTSLTSISDALANSDGDGKTPPF